MFTAACIIIQNWEQPKCPLICHLIQMVGYPHNGYYSALKNQTADIYIAMWIDLKILW